MSIDTILIAATATKAVGGLGWQEFVVFVAHLPTGLMIPVLGVIAWKLYFGKKVAKWN